MIEFSIFKSKVTILRKSIFKAQKRGNSCHFLVMSDSDNDSNIAPVAQEAVVTVKTQFDIQHQKALILFVLTPCVNIGPEQCPLWNDE
jgi:hypothetical protein